VLKCNVIGMYVQRHCSQPCMNFLSVNVNPFELKLKESSWCFHISAFKGSSNCNAHRPGGETQRVKQTADPVQSLAAEFCKRIPRTRTKL
jgi:hypothetical protein